MAPPPGVTLKCRQFAPIGCVSSYRLFEAVAVQEGSFVWLDLAIRNVRICLRDTPAPSLDSVYVSLRCSAQGSSNWSILPVRGARVPRTFKHSIFNAQN